LHRSLNLNLLNSDVSSGFIGKESHEFFDQLSELRARRALVS